MEGEVKMDVMMWFVSIIIAVAIGFFVFGDNMMRFMYKDSRVKKSSGNALDNVRIDNRAVGSISKPVEIEPLGIDKFKLIMKSIHAPFHETILILNPAQLKHDPIETLHTGRIHYWIAQDEFLAIESTSPQPLAVQHPNGNVPLINAHHPTYTHKELGKMSEDAFNKWKKAESEVTSLKANIDQEVNKRVDQAAKLTSSSKERNIGKGR